MHKQKLKSGKRRLGRSKRPRRMLDWLLWDYHRGMQTSIWCLWGRLVGLRRQKKSCWRERGRSGKGGGGIIGVRKGTTENIGTGGIGRSQRTETGIGDINQSPGMVTSTEDDGPGLETGTWRGEEIGLAVQSGGETKTTDEEAMAIKTEFVRHIWTRDGRSARFHALRRVDGAIRVEASLRITTDDGIEGYLYGHQAFIFLKYNVSVCSMIPIDKSPCELHCMCLDR